MKNHLKKIPFVLSILLLILLSFVLFFLQKEINLKNEEAQQSMIDLENENNRRTEIRLLNSSIETIKGDKAQLETHFAKSSDIVPFLDTIELLAPLVGAKAETTAVDIPKDGNGLIVRMTASGSFRSVYKFLTLLENSPYELDFVGVDMHREDGGEVSIADAPVKEGKWEAIFTMKLLTFIK